MTMLLIIAAVASIAAVAAVSLYLLRRRRSAWLRFARRHGLDVVADEDLGAPTLRGEIDGRGVLLRSSAESSDTGALGVEVLTARVRLRGDVPSDLEVTAKNMVSALEGAADREIADFDDEFAAAARVQADDAAAAHAFLDATRRGAITDAFASVDTPDVGIVGTDPVLGGAAIFARWREASADIDRLEARLRLLLRCAERLDG